jgi:hypothetical protein
MSIRSLVLGHALFVLAAASAGIAGCGSDAQPIAKVYINSLMTGRADLCGVTDPTWVGIGTAAESVHDGDNDAAGTPVHVSCSITSNADGSFQVNAIGTLGQIGSVTVTGKFTTDRSAPQTGIRAVFQRGDFGHFEQEDCTATYSSLGPPPTFSAEENQFTGVAAGRVWATIDCPNAADSTQQRMVNGMAVARSCDGKAEVKFENCGQ